MHKLRMLFIMTHGRTICIMTYALITQLGCCHLFAWLLLLPNGAVHSYGAVHSLVHQSNTHCSAFYALFDYDYVVCASECAANRKVCVRHHDSAVCT